MKATPLCLLIVLQPSCCLAFISKSHAGISGRLPPSSSPMSEATSTSKMFRKRLTQMSLAISPLESASTVLSLADVSSSLQIFYTAALVAGVGYSQRMAGRNDFKKDMATKIANGLITPEELVDEITLMAEEINNDISESKSFAEAAQVEVQNLLEEMRAMQEKVQQIPDALNIEKAALAIEKEEPAVKATVQEKVLVTAGGGGKEKVTAGGRKEENAIPIGVVEGFGVYDDVFEMEEVEEEEKEWSVPVVHHDDDESNVSMQKKDTPDAEKSGAVELATDALKTNEASAKAEESKVPTQEKDTADAVKKEAVGLVTDALKTNGADRVETSAKAEESKESKPKKDTVAAKAKYVKKDAVELAADALESTESIRKQAEDFRARIKQMEARISSDTAKPAEAKVTKVTSDPKPSPSAPAVEDRIRSDVAKQAKETALPDIKPSPPLSEPSVQVLNSVAKSIEEPKKVIPDGPIRSSPLARLLCSDLGVELSDVYPGTGLNGRVIADDVRNYAKNRGN